jgi:hypothetical protein
MVLVKTAHDLHDLTGGFTWPPNYLRKAGTQGSVVINFGKLLNRLKLEVFKLFKGLLRGDLPLGDGV